MGSFLDFGGRVVSGFRRSQGFLLAGAVAYDTLLAIVPLFVVLLVGLSHVVDQHRLLDTVASNLQLVIPGQAAAVTAQVENFLAHREVVGVVGLLALVFFSSTAFTVIESAMAIIFCHRAGTQHRHFLVSVFLPYLFMMLIGVGLLLIAVISSALHAVRAVRVFGHTWPPAGLSGAVLYLGGHRAGPAADRVLHGVAGGADTLRARLGWGRHRDRALGGDPACHDVVLRHALDGERDLRGDGRVILLFGGEVIAEIDRARVGRARARTLPAPMDDGVRASHLRRAGLRFRSASSTVSSRPFCDPQRGKADANFPNTDHRLSRR